MEIILVRHAQSEDNAKLLFSGATESKLTDEGTMQATLLARYLAKNLTQVQEVYTSPQARAMATAQAISHGLLLGEPQVDDLLSEVNLGDIEGLTAEQIEQQFPGQMEIWAADPEAAVIPNAESLSAAATRLHSFCQAKFEKHPDGRIIIVSHGLLIRCFLTKLLIRPFKDIWLFDIDNAGYSVIEWDKSHPQVVKINQTDHLAPQPKLE